MSGAVAVPTPAPTSVSRIAALSAHGGSSPDAERTHCVPTPSGHIDPASTVTAEPASSASATAAFDALITVIVNVESSAHSPEYRSPSECVNAKRPSTPARKKLYPGS